MTTSDKPDLVSVGLPTFNRVNVLKRAIESVLAQDYYNFELVISDNASTDETQALCEEFCRRDNRIRYIRQPINRGAAFNFRAVLEHARGELFMWLADDDWLSPDYISLCRQVMVEQPEYAIVAGRAKHCDRDEVVRYDGDHINLSQASGSERVLDYLRQIKTDGAFYGVMRREVLLREPIRANLGSDWFLISSVLFTGKLRMLDDTHLYRTDEGASATAESIVRSVGLPLFFARNLNLFYLKIASSAFYDILMVSPSFKSLGRWKRLSIAYEAFRVIQKRFVKFQPEPGTARSLLDSVRSKVIIRTRLKRAAKSGKRKIDAVWKAGS